MLLLILGLVIFFAVHIVPTVPDLKQGLVQRFGEGAFKVAFSIVSLAGLALIVFGYHKLQINPGKNVVLWDPPTWTRHLAMLLMLPALILLVASQIPSRIRTAAKHPMLAAIKIWALAHLLANGDLASLPDPQTDAARVKEGHDQWLVLIGICTHLGCIPLAHQGNYDGFFCPCHGSQYDTSGRIRQGPAPLNLAVPPYAFLTDTKIRIG